jgi:serine/threonine protein kinase
MTPNHLRQIEELYHSVRESSVDWRAMLLAQADPEIRREVESLLARQDESLPTLDPATMTQMYSSTRLGPYQVESKLGEGGMGEVFRAVDTRLGRGVAIKVVDQLSASRNPGRSASVPMNSLATTIWAISSHPSMRFTRSNGCQPAISTLRWSRMTARLAFCAIKDCPR